MNKGYLIIFIQNQNYFTNPKEETKWQEQQQQKKRKERLTK